MKSLRLRLLIGTTLGTAVVLLLAGILAYVLFRRDLIAQFDAGLLEKAHLLASTIERDGGEVEVEFEELDMEEFGEGGSGYLVVAEEKEATEQQLLYLSPSLRTGTRGQSGGVSRWRDGRRFPPDGAIGWVEVDWLTFARGTSLVFEPRLDGSHAPVEGKVRLSLFRDAGPLVAGLRRIALLLGVAGLVALCLTVGVGLFISRNLLKPLEDLASHIRRRDEGNLEPIALPVPPEIEPVVGRLNELLARIRAAIERERTFSDDVAHELRTPLAGLRSSLEVTLRRPRDAEAYRETAETVFDIVEVMEQMVERLLTLSRLDAGRVDPDTESVDPASLLRDIWEPLAERAAGRNLEVHFHLENCGPIETDRPLLGLLLRNLLDNAVHHSREGGDVTVEANTDEAGWRLTVTNSTDDLAQPDLDHLFERFWRKEQARTQEDGHHGLGLPLARRIARTLGGTLKATLPEDGLFEIRLHLPHVTGLQMTAGAGTRR